MVCSDVPEANQAIPAARVKQVRVVRIELAGENFVGVGGLQQPMAYLLNSGHSCIIEDLDVRLRTSHAEVSIGIRTVNGVKTVFFVKADVLN